MQQAKDGARVAQQHHMDSKGESKIRPRGSADELDPLALVTGGMGGGFGGGGDYDDGGGGGSGGGGGGLYGGDPNVIALGQDTFPSNEPWVYLIEYYAPW